MKRQFRATLAAFITLVAVAQVSTASAAGVSGLHDARYCEIIELRGAPPDATAIVWNTLYAPARR